MPIEREDDEFELDDLDLSGLTVTVMRDTVAIPETGASGSARAWRPAPAPSVRTSRCCSRGGARTALPEGRGDCRRARRQSASNPGLLPTTPAVPHR